MNFWRWSVSLVCLVALLGLIGSGLSSRAGDKKDVEKKDVDKKDVDKKDEKKADDKKPDDKKVDDKKVDDKKTDDKKATDKKADDKKPDDKKPDDKKADDKKADDKKVDDKKDKKEEAAKGDYVWKAFDSKFAQKLETVTVQKLVVQDQTINQTQEQTFYVTWTPKEKKDGNWVVDQKIEGIKMSIDIGGNKIEYDSDSKSDKKNPMTDFFDKLKGQTLTYHVDPKDMKIVKIENREKLITDLSTTNPQMKTLLDTLLSEDALKQMAQPTWGAFPTDPGKTTWPKTVELNLGNIGSYKSELTYTISKTDKNKIDITSSLTYTKPSKDLKGAPRLPFTIKEADTKGMTAKGSGSAEFDPVKGRFKSIKMNTQISGLKLTIEVGNVSTDVTINQTQDSTVTTADTIEELKKIPEKK